LFESVAHLRAEQLSVADFINLAKHLSHGN
jgi:hypothetical protein